MIGLNTLGNSHQRTAVINLLSKLSPRNYERQWCKTIQSSGFEHCHHIETSLGEISALQMEAPCKALHCPYWCRLEGSRPQQNLLSISKHLQRERERGRFRSMHLAGSIYHKSGSHWEHNMQGARNLDSSPPSRHQACYQFYS